MNCPKCGDKIRPDFMPLGCVKCKIYFGSSYKQGYEAGKREAVKKIREKINKNIGGYPDYFTMMDILKSTEEAGL